MFELVAKFHHLVHCTGYFDHHNVSTDRHHVLTTRLHDEEPTTRELFDQIDANGDGIITKDEAILAAQEIQGCSAGAALENVDSLFSTFDQDHSEGIDYNEFLLLNCRAI
eukprot:Tamp_34054.p1 GENE.Tamp_34054~~Tamp_34054.p1  ORF type:complete len:110 (+),score=23.98 Tamp_34054:184-513(+)